MIEVARRARNQPAPPHVLFEALTQPNRDPYRPWLHLLDDEPVPDASLIGHLRKRLNQLINADLRYTFGQ